MNHLLGMSLVWEIGLGVLGLILLLICSALISGSEIAYFSLSPNDHERLEQEDDNTSRRMLWLLSQPEKLLATILINNNFINIAIVLLAEIVVSQIIPTTSIQAWVEAGQAGWTWLQGFEPASLATIVDFTITVVGITFLLVLFGEVTPKVYASLNSVQLARFMASPLSVTMQLFAPLSKLLVSWSHRLEKRLSVRQASVGLTSKEDIGEAIELTVSHENGEGQDMDILKRIVKFAEVSVRQIMRSRVDVVAIDESSSYQEILAIIRESGYSRYPIYENDADNVKGMLYAKDLLMHLHEAEDFKWLDLIRTNVLFVPESKKINDLLRDFQVEHLHMAVVVDEYGGTSGIVTLEDVLEEVIGEIQDEFDDEPDVIYQKIDDNNYVFEGKSMLNDVCRILRIESDSFDAIKGESESLAGLLLERLGRMPKKDQELQLEIFKFKVLTVSNRRIEKILITLLPPE